MRWRRRRKRPPGGLPTPQLDRLALPRQVDRRVMLGRSEGESMRGRGNGVRWGTEQEPAPTTNPPRRLAIFFFSPLLLLPPACTVQPLPPFAYCLRRCCRHRHRHRHSHCRCGLVYSRAAISWIRGSLSLTLVKQRALRMQQDEGALGGSGRTSH
ncbi:hypothetical protein GUJ93_ZPchr0003g17389 [Zizania palustris]|uniref:Uncharacterized protein n=1 Tax=Zizania palustris TaxID=103762 RepID=A0A8J5SN25_ZIZPA|nr:hypothetical protein GUJ93_ZPchr0003g17389 [Zizania palustris]